MMFFVKNVMILAKHVVDQVKPIVLYVMKAITLKKIQRVYKYV